ncbi:putative histidine-tRNA ligase [Filobasidium floriforme]|uniref:putative histidine-tRNA ligase n=1 Tax=Filobasidium floriforme TaxID=5210 RepID=UPI001E8E5C35|nr:putative histidine-tRNA ligase [Filobasidium floriforme]KAH8080206.1 putative histidine-tRNA ligase [Filobasidium floriforme]
MLFSGFTRRITSRINTSIPRFQPHLYPAYSTRAEYKNKMSTGFEAERARITELAEAIKQLKTDGKPCDVELKEMLDLKKKVGQSTGKKDSGKGKIQLKTPKGTLDHGPSATLLRKQIFNTLENIFLKHGASTIDTPVFELKDILAGKYGEDSKLIYDLQDQGGELCSLRYDLTVPFARYLAMNAQPSMKRYHIGKVYRRDQPVMSKGRMREFYQCDFDIAGAYDAMVPDAEVLYIACEALTALDIGEFTIKLNHRKILDGIFELAGVPADKTRAISSAVDKLDKAPWTEVRKEMTIDKGLDGVIADKIGEYVGLKGKGWEVLEKLKSDDKLTAVKSAKEGLADMELLFGYLDVMGVLDKMSFDMSLARGLDYYTGIIYEAIHQSSAPPGFKTQPAVPAEASSSAPAPSKPKKAGEEDEVDESTVGVGSIAAGGRYDELVGMFSEAAGGKKGAGKVPCVGISVGVERVYSILLQKRKEREEREARGKETEVYIVSMGGNGLLKERMALAKDLWDGGIKAEFMYKNKPKPNAQLDACDRDQTPFTVILGPSEVETGTAKVRRQLGKEGGTTEGETVQRAELVEFLKRKLAEL